MGPFGRTGLGMKTMSGSTHHPAGAEPSSNVAKYFIQHLITNFIKHQSQDLLFK